MWSACLRVGVVLVCVSDLTTPDRSVEAASIEDNPKSEGGCYATKYTHNVLTKHRGCSGAACRLRPGSSAEEGQLISVTCEAGYQLADGSQSFSVCQHGFWTPSVPQCLRAGASPKNLTYVGCFKTDFVAQHESYYKVRGPYHQQHVTLEDCAPLCDARLVTHMGLRADDKYPKDIYCYCGNDLPVHSTKMEGSQCGRCADDSSRHCGGKGVMSVYKLREYSPLMVLLASNRGVMAYRSDDNKTSMIIPLRGVVQAIDFHYTRDETFFRDNNKILKSKFDLTYSGGHTKSYIYSEPDTIFTLENEQGLNDVVVDWLNDKTYWSVHDMKAQKSRIYQRSSDGSVNSAYYVMPGEVYNIFAMVVDPYNKTLFFVANGTIIAKQLESNTLKKFDVRFVKPRFAIDLASQLIYTIVNDEKEHNTIVSLDYSGRRMSDVFSGPELADVYGIDVYNGVLVWVSYGVQTLNLYSCKLTKPPRICERKNFMVLDGIDPDYIDVYDVKIFHPERQTPTLKSLCQEKRCSHSCARTSLFTVKCSCPDNLILADDGGSCEDDPKSLEGGCYITKYTHNVLAKYGCSGAVCRLRPGSTVAHDQLISVTCEEGYQLSSGTQSYSVCQKGLWSPKIAQCYRASSAPGEVTAVGCYQTDFVDQHASYYQVPDQGRGRLTFQDCVQICNARQVTHAGIRADKKDLTKQFCYCGNDLTVHSTVVEDAHCGLCQDDPARHCGGEATMTVYKLRESSPQSILLATNRDIKMYRSDDNKTSTVLPYRGIAHAIDYHFTHDQIFFEADNKVLRSRYELMKNKNSSKFNLVQPDTIFSNEQGLKDVIVDWLNDKTYWSVHDMKEQKSRIYQRSSDGSVNSAYYVMPGEVYNIFTMVVDPYNKTMFFVANGTIMSRELEGNKLQVFDVNFVKPRMAVDLHSQLIYTIVNDKEEHNKIISLDYQGHRKSDVFSGPELADVYGLDVYNDILVWNSYGVQKISLYSCKLTRPSQTCERENLKVLDEIDPDYIDILDIKIFHPERQTPTLQWLCGQQRCSHLCQRASLFTVKCSCPAGLSLASDHSTCHKTSTDDEEGGADTSLGNKDSKSQEDCRLPDYPQNRYELFDCQVVPGSDCSLGPGDVVTNGQLVQVSCAQGHKPTGQGYSICRQGAWSHQITRCIKSCAPLKSLTLDLECWQGTSQVSCEDPILPNSQVKYQCKQYHIPEYSGQPQLQCHEDGTWNRELPRCYPACGHSTLNSVELTPTIVGGEKTELGKFPWHAGVFHLREGRWTNVCGGTLVSPGAILTAAHCVTDKCANCKSEQLNSSDVMVALGKTLRDWYEPEEYQVKRAVKSIHVDSNYVGPALNYERDIAVLILESRVPVSAAVMPACLDQSNSHVRDLTSSGRLGYVAGWGNVDDCARGEACDHVSEQLVYTTTTVIDFNTCLAEIQKRNRTSYVRLSSDKLCTGNGSVSVIQGGDSGGGLIFRFNGVHFVYGVISVKLKIKDRYSFGAFTNVAQYMNWVTSKIG